jgi:hypothetical protein
MDYLDPVSGNLSSLSYPALGILRHVKILQNGILPLFRGLPDFFSVYIL